MAAPSGQSESARVQYRDNSLDGVRETTAVGQLLAATFHLDILIEGAGSDGGARLAHHYHHHQHRVPI